MSRQSPEVRMVPIDSIKPHPRNPRRGDIDVIVESIHVNGFFGAIIVQESTGVILAGNHRWKAARKAGMSEVPVMMADVTDEQALKILLADNRTSDVAGYDMDSLTGLLRDVLAQDDLMGTGWSADDLDRMIAESADLPESVEEKDLRPLERTFFLVSAPIDLHDSVARALDAIDGIAVASSQN